MPESEAKIFDILDSAIFLTVHTIGLANYDLGRKSFTGFSRP